MADSFFGFDTSLSNLNDDEGGGEPSEDEYDALNDETFGQDSEEFDWEVEHETLAQQLESNRRLNNSGIDETANTQLEASLSQLVLDETDSPQSRVLGSSVWRHDLSFPAPPAPLKNVCTVEELERQLRQKPIQYTQNYFQPRFPVILQRPPGLQAPVPLPFAPPAGHNMAQMTPPLNKIIGNNIQMNMGQNQLGQNVNQFMQNANQMGQFQNNQISQTNLLGQLSQNMHMNQSGQLLQNQMSQNQMTQNQIQQNPIQNLNQMNSMGQNVNQMGHSVNQMGQSMNQMSQNVNQMGQNVNPMGQNVNQLGQGVNQMGQGVNQMGQNLNQMGHNVNQMGQNLNQMGQNVNQMGQGVNQMGQNQMLPNGNQFPGMNQFPRMMGQPRMMAPPPGINMPRQNFSPNMNQYNTNFRGPTIQSKPNTEPTQQTIPKPHSPKLSKTPTQKLQKTDPKVQKSRVYNNSKTQNLTSQNLVQLIQNTHPMLQQYNNSYHNASHHPMLNRNLFGNGLLNNQFMYNQRQNGVYNNRQMNGDDSSATSEDEYAGLMTQREKQWLVNIQMLQLNTGTPYIHDFYYTVFLERQARKEKEGVKEAHKANQQNHPFYSGGVKQEGHARERHNSVRHNSTSEDSTPRTYVPTQFENSLGKLQCGSVTAPRKIIDVELVAGDRSPARGSRAPSRASTANPAEVPREMKRTKQLLLDIEALYLILLRLEELNDPLAISNALILKEREEKQKQLEAAQKEEEDDDTNVFLRNIESVQRRPKPESKGEIGDKRQVVNLAVNLKPAPVKNLLDEDKDELINKMFAGLLHNDRLQQMLTVRKGRMLVCRFLSRARTHARARSVWSRVLRALPAAARRDDGTLAALAPHFHTYIHSTTGWSAVLESCGLLAEAFDPARTAYALTTAFTLTCVCALIEKASILVNTPDATSNERQWSKFLKTLARSLKNTTLTVARPLKPLPENRVLYHLRQLDSRSTIEILQRGKSAEFVDLSKNDVMELLVKHLC
ncbi:uncharacterized protein Patr-1 [Plodia interpunctella]|uniref:uncharacterized protein Patr-1 n=1 Tax=Plodia interpunctella TaxID=58824 RepID=UPI00236855B4|nr:uncharacterized protein LOC128681837 [Plodia interpunctella]